MKPRITRENRRKIAVNQAGEPSYVIDGFLKHRDKRTDLQNFFSEYWGATWDEVLIVLRGIDSCRRSTPDEVGIMEEIVRRMWEEIEASRKRKEKK